MECDVQLHCYQNTCNHARDRLIPEIYWDTINSHQDLQSDEEASLSPHGSDDEDGETQHLNSNNVSNVNSGSSFGSSSVSSSVSSSSACDTPASSSSSPSDTPSSNKHQMSAFEPVTTAELDQEGGDEHKSEGKRARSKSDTSVRPVELKKLRAAVRNRSNSTNLDVYMAPIPVLSPEGRGRKASCRRRKVSMDERDATGKKQDGTNSNKDGVDDDDSDSDDEYERMLKMGSQGSANDVGDDFDQGWSSEESRGPTKGGQGSSEDRQGGNRGGESQGSEGQAGKSSSEERSGCLSHSQRSAKLPNSQRSNANKQLAGLYDWKTLRLSLENTEQSVRGPLLPGGLLEVEVKTLEELADKLARVATRGERLFEAVQDTLAQNGKALDEQSAELMR